MKHLISLCKILIGMVMFTIISLCMLILYSDATFKDVFTCGRVSILQTQKSYSNEIVIDTSYLLTNGGVKNLTEKLIAGIASKRPKWRLIILTNKNALHDKFKNLTNVENIKIISVCSNYNYFCDFYMREFYNLLTCGILRDKLTQLFAYNNICIDNKIDLLWDPCGEFALNDFALPTVHTFHDLAYIDLPYCFTDTRRNWLIKNAKRIIKHDTKIITVSDFTKRRMTKFFHRKDIEVIPICLAQRIKGRGQTNQQILQRFDLVPRKYFLYTAALWQHKNHKRLIRAFRLFQNIYKTDIRLVMVGAYGHSERLKQYVKGLKQNDPDILFTDFLPDEQLNQLLANALAFIYPSLYEGFGMPILEAMAMGIPVLCSRVASLPEVAGSAAYFFNPLDVNDIAHAMYKIVTDTKLRYELIDRGYQQSAKFSDTDYMINRYISVLEQAMKNH